MNSSLRLLSQAQRKILLNEYDSIQVGYMNEQCIRVDEHDNVIRSVSKEEAHSSNSLALHRAFSVFSFTENNKLLMQKRSSRKITFPNLWTNTCCSHPLHNEREINGSIGAKRAAVRKLKHELGIDGVDEGQFSLMGRYLYRAEMEDAPWGEHELDYALILRGVGVDRCRVNENEVSDIREVNREELNEWIRREPESFTPWMKLFSKTKTFQSWWKLGTHELVEDSRIFKLN